MSQRPQLGLFTPKLPKFEEVNWLVVFAQPDFRSIGLCQRHVQIDDTGRDWFGMPFLEDADAARVQGSPYVAKLSQPHETDLNRMLWQLETLSQREHSITARASYHAQASGREWGGQAYTPTEHLENYVKQCVEIGIYPSPTIAAGIARREGEGLPDFNEEGDSVPSPFEKFIWLDYVSQVIRSLEYCIQWKRQTIYFEALVSRERSEQIRAEEARQARSQQHWARIDAERELLRLRALQVRRQAPERTESVVAEQLDMFGEEAPRA
ncbi:MAG: hypothetical protein ACRYFR_04790 [Janthinobacterium lividum]